MSFDPEKQHDNGSPPGDIAPDINLEEISSEPQAANPETTQQDEESTLFSSLRVPAFQWKSFFVFFLVCMAMLFHWFSTSDLFEIPPDVQKTRQDFVKAKQTYKANASYWDAKLTHFKESMNEELAFGEQAFLELIQETPGEIFVSFLLQHLNVSIDRLEEIAAFPRRGSTFSIVVSKPEGGIWPLNIMLSMEIEIKYTAEKFSLAIARLRRGSQDIALSLAWAYFGPELENLRAFEAKAQQVILVTTKD